MADESSSAPESVRRDVPAINMKVPHPARVYDYFLGGKDNFEADRIAAEAAIQAFPRTAESARTARAFLRRVVRFLAAEAGIRQFLDISAGLPRGENVHQVAQSVAPDAKIVYVDNDHLAYLAVLIPSALVGLAVVVAVVRAKQDDLPEHRQVSDEDQTI